MTTETAARESLLDSLRRLGHEEPAAAEVLRLLVALEDLSPWPDDDLELADAVAAAARREERRLTGR